MYVKSLNFEPLGTLIETPRWLCSEESDSVEDFSIVLLANPAVEPTGDALAGIQPNNPGKTLQYSYPLVF
jgi:hypothetical protein